MLISWILFVVCAVVGYMGIAWFAQLSGGSSHSVFEAFTSAIRPFPLLVATVANMFFGLGLYYGFGVTRFAIPAAISIGVITSFIYSVVLLGAQVTLVKLLGIMAIIGGVVLLAL